MSIDSDETLRSSSSASEFISITQPTCSAENCGNSYDGMPTIPCPNCLLVVYCKEACREHHWPEHKRDCTIDLSAASAISTRNCDSGGDKFVLKSFWSSYAATDVLNLDKNEGRYYDGDLDLLFTGDSGIRHFIYSIVKMPETASPKMFVAFNETTSTHLARTFLALALLSARDYDPILNAEAVVHMWYSAKLPRRYLDHIQTVVRVHTGNALDNIAQAHLVQTDGNPRRTRLHWSMNRMSVDAELLPAQWMSVREHTFPLVRLNAGECALLRLKDSRRHTEPSVRFLARMTRSRALGVIRWQQDGLLLPYGHPREDFDTPNPIFFRNPGSFPLGATSEPLSEWPMELLDYEDCPSKNDVYGKMFYYLRDMLVEFQRRTASLSISVRLTCEVMAELSSWSEALQFERPFDRIEIGHHFDSHPFLSLAAASNLLRHEDENPFATLLTITKEAVISDVGTVRKELESEKKDLYRPANTALDELAPPVAEGADPKSRDVVRRRLGLIMWRNWDRFALRYLHSPARFAFASLMEPAAQAEHVSVILTGFLGLVTRDKHSIVRKWPNRLVHSKKDKPGLKDFNRALGWPMPAPQHWLEWKRCADVPLLRWNEWMKIATSMSRPAFESALESIVSGQTGDEDSSSETGATDGKPNGTDEASVKDSVEEISSGLDNVDIDSIPAKKKKKSKKSKSKKK
ncbi:hypothetical protein HIM_07215 [Hirsutella minnesotensis 3608]|uniref:MYND-type domain-containing protein n=1 Tax=Hirsutella minnesotensis 3608 TaxID=1043627 RepID=A0A0F7ZI48_9HYPO|nr:hypothetical protein HIM_07215 [Hirsutella minnesotensis 3608]